ncbi:hypothetical protein SNE40_000455 [Patella caerulea]|uniref:Uncharacterized protein n=1 Tax=Patella caerulea TaxID=87958 RepID=A0AAN8KAI0_PATCE
MSGIRQSLSTIWVEFLSGTSIHGLKNTFAGQHGPVKKTLWFICFGVMVGILTYTTYNFFMKYFEYNFVTRTSVTYHSELEFPAVTLCNLHSFDKNNLNKSDPLVLEYVEHMYSQDVILNASDSKWRELVLNEEDLNMLGFGIHDMIIQGYLRNPLQTNVESKFSVTYRAPLQKCFTFNGRYSNGKYQNKPLKFQANSLLLLHLDTNFHRYAFGSVTAGFRLLVHHPDEPFHVHSPVTKLSPGYFHEINLFEKRYKYLSSPYNSYQNKDCLQVDKLNQGVSEDHFPYSHASCVVKSLTDFTQALCGCIIESLVHDNSSVVCTVAKRHSCVWQIWRGFHASSAAKFLDCKVPCSEIKYDYDLSSVLFTPGRRLHNRDSKTILYLKISFKDMMVTMTSHEPELDFKDIVSHLGGYMGFCLGASVLTLIELVELVLKCLKATKIHRHSLLNFTKAAPPTPGGTHEIHSV